MLGLTTEGVLHDGTDRDCRHVAGPGILSERSGVTLRLREHPETHGQQLESLARTIESEIIPRLMLAHRSLAQVLPKLVPGDSEITDPDVAEFSRLVLTTDIATVVSAIDMWRLRGISAKALCLQLLAPTARHLGELWEADLCDFIEVTVGLGRLQQVLHELAPDLEECDSARVAGQRILLAPAPGDQHSLGLLIVREFFRSAGWDVSGGTTLHEQDARALLRAEWFDVAGLSVGSECRLEAVSKFIRSIRAASRNRNIVVLVGGPIFTQRPEYVEKVGADATAADAPQALALAKSLIMQRR